MIATLRNSKGRELPPVLVTGGTGHLGRDLVRRLVQEGHRVRVFARSPGPEADVEWAIGDLATVDGLAAALQDVYRARNGFRRGPRPPRDAVLVDVAESSV